MKKTMLLALLLFVLFGAFKSDLLFSNKKSDLVEVPTLIQRSEQIQMEKEWDFVQNFYADQNQRIQKNPENLEAYLNLAELFVKEARVTGEHGHYYPAALKMTNKVLASNGISEKKMKDLHFKALVTKAGVQLSLHEFADALETGQKAIKITPYNAQLYGVLVDCYVELGRYEEAIAMADKMVSIKPDIRSYSRVSYLRELHGDVEGALEAMTLAVKSGYPGYEETAWAMLTLGDLYNQYGDSESARKVYQNILETRKDYPFAIAALADLALDKGDYKTAEEELNRAAAIIPEVGYYSSLARLYKEQNRKEEFDAIIKEIMVMLQEDVDSGHVMNMEYASIYKDLLEDPATALKFAMKEYDQRPDNINVNRLIANIQLDLNNMEAARMHFIASSVTNSKHPELKSISAQL